MSYCNNFRFSCLPIFSAILILVFSNIVLAQTSQQAFVVSHITENIYLFSNKGGNIAVSRGEDGLLVVDNGNADEAELLSIALQEFGEGADLAYIINTHWHNDHSGANNLLGHSADIVAHDNVRKHLSVPQRIELFNMSGEAFEPQGLPTITFPEQVNLHINGDQVSLKHYGPGHSDSDAVVFFEKANLVHMGDSMVYPMYPFIDFAHGGNTFSYIETLELVYNEINEDTIVVPGHGVLTDKAGIREFIEVLEQTIEEVRVMKAQGLTSAEAQAKGLDPKWAAWSESAITEEIWIDEIYQSL